MGSLLQFGGLKSQYQLPNTLDFCSPVMYFRPNLGALGSFSDLVTLRLCCVIITLIKV